MCVIAPLAALEQPSWRLPPRDPNGQEGKRLLLRPRERKWDSHWNTWFDSFILLATIPLGSRKGSSHPSPPPPPYGTSSMELYKPGWTWISKNGGRKIHNPPLIDWLAKARVVQKNPIFKCQELDVLFAFLCNSFNLPKQKDASGRRGGRSRVLTS